MQEKKDDEINEYLYLDRFNHVDETNDAEIRRSLNDRSSAPIIKTKNSWEIIKCNKKVRKFAKLF